MTLSGSRRWALQYASGLFADRGAAAATAALFSQPPTAPNLTLLGNCGSVATPSQEKETRDFLARCSANWERVFWVPGPHELASPSKELVTDQLHYLRTLAAEAGENVILLDKSEYPFHKDDIVLIGITGWSDLIGYGADLPPTSLEATHIWTTGGYAGGQAQNPRTVDIQEWHTEALEWLRQRINWWSMYRPGMRTVILTHHLCTPSLLSSGLTPTAYKRATLDTMSEQSTETFLSGKGGWVVPPSAWLCGATGSSCSGIVGGRRTFIGVNSLFGAEGTGAATTAANPRWMAGRRFELPPGKVRME